MIGSTICGEDVTLNSSAMYGTAMLGKELPSVLLMIMAAVVRRIAVRLIYYRVSHLDIRFGEMAATLTHGGPVVWVFFVVFFPGYSLLVGIILSE